MYRGVFCFVCHFEKVPLNGILETDWFGHKLLERYLLFSITLEIILGLDNFSFQFGLLIRTRTMGVWTWQDLLVIVFMLNLLPSLVSIGILLLKCRINFFTTRYSINPYTDCFGLLFSWIVSIVFWIDCQITSQMYRLQRTFWRLLANTQKYKHILVQVWN